MSAKDMFYKAGTEFSNAEDRVFAREELVYNVTEDLLVILEDMDVSKQELARRLGKSRSYVTQILSGARNMTLGTLSDVCFTLGIKPKVVLPVQPAVKAVEVEMGVHWEDESAQRQNYLSLKSENVVDCRSLPAWETAA
jgi:transcriptional regulator with XRE-family HTH domain